MISEILAASSNAQDAALSRLGWEFNSSRCYHNIRVPAEVGGKKKMPGRSMAGRESLKLAMSVRFAPRQPDLF